MFLKMSKCSVSCFL